MTKTSIFYTKFINPCYFCARYYYNKCQNWSQTHNFETEVYDYFITKNLFHFHLIYVSTFKVCDTLKFINLFILV